MDSEFNLLKEWQYPKSVGLVYTTVTKFLGLRPLEDEYVVMGLSAYHDTSPESKEISDWLIACLLFVLVGGSFALLVG